MPDYSDPAQTIKNICNELSNQDATLGASVGADGYQSVATSTFCHDAGATDSSDGGADYTSIDPGDSDTGADSGYDPYQAPAAGFDASSALDAGTDYGSPDAGFDASSSLDAGTDYGSPDAGFDASSSLDAGIDYGSPDAGFDASSSLDAGIDYGSPDAGL